ncbi:hypothetical protein H0A36_08525 [Endozoicomonas sp. SM1973]|uniref:Uncharacterized protein n=1 Tax=Spartinivicinus marinus TaxID=2994442 RepID=A0A853IF08_9GAMM|nr:hypothetical protein [Spartinivicinus marinus]MCX4027223.1 hypothetical protein [Spartinivicinus marinus]NYZ66056.1 hypothetical protein [Spartinivicinus marinus]
MSKNKFNGVFNRSLVKATACLSVLLFTSTAMAMNKAVEEVNNDLTNDYQPAIEDLHGLQVTEKLASIVVTSTGCTKKEDFIVVSDKSVPPKVTFIRLKPDYCRAASRPYLIRFSLEEVGARKFSVVNPVIPSPSDF